MANFDIDSIENATLNGLKDFQKATVERIYELYKGGQRRVLVADEVGLGKTLIARGAIVKTARLRLEENDPLFKVVYICSNISIANQNIRKLRVSESARVEGVSDTRLSMQHLKIAQQELDPELKNDYIQLIPLTPDTSFRMTTGGGVVGERALMFAVLSKMPELRGHIAELEKMFVYGADRSWEGARDFYAQEVKSCNRGTKGAYLSDLLNDIRTIDEDEHIIDLLREHLRQKKQGKTERNDSQILNKFRVMFARISAKKLQPDLVIMDEFQRFRFLIGSNEDTETGILAKQFLMGSDTRILLLSATPYKLYSTFEEITEANGIDEHYEEFLQVMDFLFPADGKQFRKVWTDYNVALHELKTGDSSILQIKHEAESAMYSGVCRTERISVMDSGDYTDDSSIKHHLKVESDDIQSYLAISDVLRRVGADFTLPVDYAKSSPFLMSYMKNYKIKEFIEQHCKDAQIVSNKLLWVDRTSVNSYLPLPDTNARLKALKKMAFENHSELFLWIPPCKPYYELQGPYRGSRNFSKVLVFSAWEMVPRMIATMISYEAERLTVGELCKRANLLERSNARYNAKQRYPNRHLQFTLKATEPQRMTLFCLLYPSKTLSGMYDPIRCMNEGMTLSAIEREVRSRIQSGLAELKRYEKVFTRNEDVSWYYLAPMLLDGDEFTEAWIDSLSAAIERSEEAGEDAISIDKGNKAFHAHISKLRDLLQNHSRLSLGRMPRDLVSVLTDMALASPAVCVYRANGQNAAYATALAKTFLNYFNTTESTAVIQLSSEKHHARKSDNSAHWQDVLTYCKDGCFQAMFDEYLHLVTESVTFSDGEDRASQVQSIMLSDLRIHTASYDVDTFRGFKKRINGEVKSKDDKTAMKMRAHYAVGFINSGADNQKTALRKDCIRGAFNSPLKPFVLATTSIGQEGLDFHNYCRKIVHWNLPSNPIDLEQREGRINRYKCLAIRQNVVERYGDIKFHKDVWTELFRAAEKERQPGQSELVPYWCFGKNQDIKIERIVPMYPMSKDGLSYERLVKILSMYRLTLGQARQEELLEYLFKEFKDTEELKKLFIDLSPFSKSPSQR